MVIEIFFFRILIFFRKVKFIISNKYCQLSLSDTLTSCIVEGMSPGQSFFHTNHGVLMKSGQLVHSSSDAALEPGSTDHSITPG